MRVLRFSNFKGMITSPSESKSNYPYLITNAYIDSVGVIRTFDREEKVVNLHGVHSVYPIDDRRILLIAAANQSDSLYVWDTINNNLRFILTLGASSGRSWVAIVGSRIYISNGLYFKSMNVVTLSTENSNRAHIRYVEMPPCMYLKPIGGRLVGARGNKVIYSEAVFCWCTQPHYFFDFGDTIVDINTVSKKLLVNTVKGSFVGFLQEGDEFIFNIIHYPELRPIPGTSSVIGNEFVFLCNEGIVITKDTSYSIINYGRVNMSIAGEGKSYTVADNLLFIGGDSLVIEILDNHIHE